MSAQASWTSRVTLRAYLTILLSMAGVTVLGYGIATEKIGFSGTIDASALLVAVVLTGFTAILRTFFGGRRETA